MTQEQVAATGQDRGCMLHTSYRGLQGTGYIQKATNYRLKAELIIKGLQGRLPRGAGANQGYGL